MARKIVGLCLPVGSTVFEVSKWTMDTPVGNIDGTVARLGSNDLVSQAETPGGEFASVSAGSLPACGAKTDRTVACWDWNDQGRAEPPGGEFISVSGGYAHTCGVRTD